MERIKIQPIKLVKSKATERGDLLKYLAGKMGWSIPRMAKQLSHLKELQDLYFLKSDCDQAEKRGIQWGAAFWTAIKPKV